MQLQAPVLHLLAAAFRARAIWHFGSRGPLHGYAGAQNFRLILCSAQMSIEASIDSQAEEIIK